jgi:NADH-quinone oxidoreductase subunit J
MTALWIVLTAFIVLCAIGVVLARSPIASALFLLVGFLGVAVLYLALQAEFVAAVQVLVYAGGIMVLYLFGIMLVDSEVLRITRQVHWQAWPVFFLILVFFVWMGRELYRSEYVAPPQPAKIVMAREGQAPAVLQEMLKREAEERQEPNPHQVARSLFRDFLYPFETASVLLLVAVLGAVFLAKKEV